jgi:hypothetical protein
MKNLGILYSNLPLSSIKGHIPTNLYAFVPFLSILTQDPLGLMLLKIHISNWYQMSTTLYIMSTYANLVDQMNMRYQW